MPKELVARINLDLIYPPFLERCLDLLAACRARGVDYFATHGYRSPEEQLALWKKGRNEAGAVVKPKEVVTRLRFGLHNVGIAMDLCCDADLTKTGLQPRWDAKAYDVLSEEAVKLGLESGHLWKGFKDSPHVQLPISKVGLDVGRLKNLYWLRGLKGVWAELDKRKFWP